MSEEAGSELGGASARRRGNTFTSTLSVNGFALCDQLCLQPLSQVMGSSIYQMGYQGAWGQPISGGSLGGATFMVELDTLSEALNEVRSRALGRLAEEALAVGGDAVVGVTTRAGEIALETGSVSLEHTVLGTAVRREGPRAQHPVLTELTVADFAKLVQAGFEPLGIVAWSSVFFAGFAFGQGLGGGMMGASLRQTYELRDFTQAFYAARERTMARLGEQAGALGASGVVGVSINHAARAHSLPGGMGAGTRSGLMVTFNAIGTAIRQVASPPPLAPRMTIDLTS
ncbi:MAG TPA: heavy metal-binding domain-containing protein [Solirubrobacteraceae bacterium]|nr:heavy metal-binding domain-containing protein [Solirubrobacteraceae bacterium]